MTGAAVAGGGLALGALAQGTSNVVNFEGLDIISINNYQLEAIEPRRYRKRNKLQSQLIIWEHDVFSQQL